MLEARDRLPGRGVVDLPLGFGIRHGPSPGDGSAARNPAIVRLSECRNRGNIPSHSPLDASSSRRRWARPKKSPLPSWCPRTPLRDISHIVRAIERRSIRVKVAAELRRRKQAIENSPVTPIPLVSPLMHKPCSSEESLCPLQASLSGHCDVDFDLTPVKNKTIEHLDKCVELEEMEKAVKEKLQNLSRTQSRKQPVRSILMSMR